MYVGYTYLCTHVGRGKNVLCKQKTPGKRRNMPPPSLKSVRQSIMPLRFISCFHAFMLSFRSCLINRLLFFSKNDNKPP